MPTQDTPASNHALSEASVLSTPPVGMIETHGHGPLTAFTKAGPPTSAPGKILTISQPEFLGLRDLRSAAATRRVGDLAPVAGARDIRIQQRTHHEIGSAVDIERSRAGIDHRSDAEDHLGHFARAVPLQFGEHLPGMIAAIGELQQRAAAGGARRRHLSAPPRYPRGRRPAPCPSRPSCSEPSIAQSAP